jgi:hypothetical protein
MQTPWFVPSELHAGKDAWGSSTRTRGAQTLPSAAQLCLGNSGAPGGIKPVGTHNPEALEGEAPQHASKITGGLVGPGSAGELHAPVLLPPTGSKHGAHRWSAGQLASLRLFARAASSGRHLGRQRPSAPVTASSQRCGTKSGARNTATGATHNTSDDGAHESRPK